MDGGSLENFPLLVRLNDLQSFASNDGGDLRFYDGQHKPLLLPLMNGILPAIHHMGTGG